MQGNHHFQVAETCTQFAVETSSPSAEDAKAILLIRGTLTTGESAKAYFAEAAQAEGGSTLGKTTGVVPGVVAKIFLQQVAGNVIGGCYLFRDAQSLDAYLASDLWASERAETPWQSVLVECGLKLLPPLWVIRDIFRSDLMNQPRWQSVDALLVVDAAVPRHVHVMKMLGGWSATYPIKVD